MKDPRQKTPLIETTVFKELYGLDSTFIKDESANMFGTIKDRRNFNIVQEANRLKVDKLVLITSGNNGYSLAHFIRSSGDSSIKLVCLFSSHVPDKTKEVLREISYQVHELNLDHKILRPEEIITFAREKEGEVIWDVTNGFESNYEIVLEEICEEFIPDYVVLPVGSGGIYICFAEAVRRKKLDTKIIGIGTQNTMHSMADKLCTPWTPYEKAMQYYQNLGHPIYRLNEEEIKRTYSIFKNIVDCEISSSVVFAAQMKHEFNNHDRVVFINSGNGTII